MDRKIILDDSIELTSNSPDERQKRWGYVSARPSEFLLVYRKGELSHTLSGQGSRVFKWPSDTVALIPTTLKEVVFQSNQITRDNVDVRVRGMVLYRIMDPLRIHGLINFSSRQRAESKLARMIADMCRSTVKWLVANMTLEECNRRRKEEIATTLKSEVASIATESWGVEIVTIDIQDVFIQDEELFKALQTAFKADKEREARMARLECEQTLERRKIEGERELQQHRHEQQVEQARLKAAAQLQQIEQRRKNDEEQFALDRYRVEQQELIDLHKTEQEQAREQIRAEGERERARIETEARKIASEEELRTLRERIAAESSAGRASLERLFLREGLPALAETLARSLEQARFTVYQTGADGQAAGPLPFALNQLMDVLNTRLSGVPEPVGNGQRATPQA